MDTLHTQTVASSSTAACLHCTHRHTHTPQTSQRHSTSTVLNKPALSSVCRQSCDLWHTSNSRRSGLPSWLGTMPAVYSAAATTAIPTEQHHTAMSGPVCTYALLLSRSVWMLVFSPFSCQTYAHTQGDTHLLTCRGLAQPCTGSGVHWYRVSQTQQHRASGQRNSAASKYTVSYSYTAYTHT